MKKHSSHKTEKRSVTKAATLKDVAILSNVSIGTVERALYNYGRISEETKSRVLQAAGQLNYQPNIVAKTLKMKTAYHIVAVYHIVPEYFTQYFTMGFRDALKRLSVYGVTLQIVRTPTLNALDAVPIIETLDLSDVDGILINCGGSELDETINRLVKKGIAVATFGSDSPSNDRLFYVGEDPYLAGQLAGELIGKFSGGHGQTLVFGGPQPVYALKKRSEGYCDVLASEYPEMEILPAILHNDDDESAIRQALNLLNNHTELAAVFCNSAGGTMALHRAIKYLNPDTIPIIVGYDFNMDILEMLQLNHAYATIFQNPYSQAFNALSYLCDYLIKGEVPAAANKRIPSQIIYKHDATFYLLNEE